MVCISSFRLLTEKLTKANRLETINSLPPNLIYKSASETAKKLAPELRRQGAELIVALTHQREPNDDKLAQSVPAGTIDIILGGHDHYYAHSVVNSTHVLRSGTDFKQLSYIEIFRKKGQQGGWDINITRRDLIRTIPQDSMTVTMVNRLTASLKAKIEKPIGYTCVALDGRFTTVRLRESNLGNFVCDLMRYYYNADCAIMAAGTIRGDQIYPPGILRLKDILNCFPFEDPVVLLRVSGKKIWDALENGVCMVPALEGRFPQVSNLCYSFNPSFPPGKRVTRVMLGGKPIYMERSYVLSTRGYMGRGKDGFSSLLVRSAGGDVEELVPEESGVLISVILRQYFLSLKVMGSWARWSPGLRRHWDRVHSSLHGNGYLTMPSPTSTTTTPGHNANVHKLQFKSTKQRYYYGRFPQHHHLDDVPEHDHMDSDSDDDPQVLTSPVPTTNYVTSVAESSEDEDRRLHLARWATRKWMKAVIDPSASPTTAEGLHDAAPLWTPGIAPKLEGRIIIEDERDVH